MFTTTFVDNSKLTVDASKFDSVVSYLDKFGCKYETLRYGSGKCVVWIDEAPSAVIDALNAKFNAPVEVPATSDQVLEFLQYVCWDAQYTEYVVNEFAITEYENEDCDNDEWVAYVASQVALLGLSLDTIERRIELVMVQRFYGHEEVEKESGWIDYMVDCKLSRHYIPEEAAA